jgi:hypothetical protein
MKDSIGKENEKICNFVTQLSGHCKYQYEKAIEHGFIKKEALDEQIWQCPICKRIYEYNASTHTWKKCF